MAITGTKARSNRHVACGRRSARGARSLALGAAAGGCLFVSFISCAVAETWHFEPTFGLQETLTNNVNLTPSATREGDLVSQITPGFVVSEKGAHTSLFGSVAVPVLLYVKTPAENNTAYAQVNLIGKSELADRFFFIDGAINVSQQFLTPFGAQPSDLASATRNRYTSQLYRVSPYIKGAAGNNISYELRDDNIWNNLSGAPISTNDSYTNQVTGKLNRDPVPFGWQLDYNLSDVRFSGSDSQIMELGRLRGLYDPDPQLDLSLSGGYERNDFPLTTYSGAIYGAGLKWHPNERTSLDGFWEHRFFGSSYGLTFDYRTPLSVWGIRASRNITTYPQQIAALPAGDVSTLLNALFSSRIADPAARQQAVDQLIRDRGLPATLSGPVNLYSQQVTLQDSALVQFGLLGARNTIFFSVFYLKSTPISGSGQALPPILGDLNANNNAQTGANVVWTHNLAPLVTFSGTANWTRTVDNPPLDRKTNQGYVQAAVTGTLSPRTTVFGGARYQMQLSNIVDNEYHEVAGFVGLNYVFH
jgi:uncharacterized protein (PEP-CTERM system associated)